MPPGTPEARSRRDHRIVRTTLSPYTGHVRLFDALSLCTLSASPEQRVHSPCGASLGRTDHLENHSCGHSCLSQTIQDSFLNILQYKFLDTHTNYWIYRSLYNPRCQTRGSGDFLHEWCPFILSSCCFPDVCFSTLLMNIPSSSQVPVLALIPVGYYFSCGIAHPVAPADHESHCILHLPVSHLLFVFNLLGDVFDICSLHTITARSLYHCPWNLWSFSKLT
ncbi:uncharacterized protein [Dendrobates tinctorius]|uniref:uncharacterized protein isoform X2 n=1 Tax=Dendrobates tinctorius TaxID=92724 RepID=UPI003CC98536